MKATIVIITLMLAALLTGCGYDAEKAGNERTEKENLEIVKNFRKLEYDGHTYIVYREVFGTKNFGGITHDPDCACNPFE